MNAVTKVLRRTRQELSIILIVVLLGAVDGSIVHNINERWLPAFGFVLGVSLACVVFLAGFPLFSSIRTMEATRTEKMAWISGLLLFIPGGVLIALNDSLARVFNIQWLNDSWGSLVFGMGLVCLGYWTLTLFSELFNDREWKFIGGFIHSLLLAGVIFKFGFGW